MLKKLLIAPATAAATLIIVALSPNAGADTKPLSFTNFDSVSVSALMTVVLKQGPYSVSVSEKNGDFTNLRVEQKGTNLIVTRQDGHTNKAPEYVVTVTAPALRQIDVAAASEVEGSNLTLKDVHVSVSSASSLSLSGACAELKVDVSSAGKFDGRDLRCQDVSVDASSGAQASAFASGKAKGNASTGGTITFHGNPSSLDKHASFGGIIKTL